MRFERWLQAFVGFQLAIAMLSLVVMMLTVVADVSMRYAFNQPIRGSYDVVCVTLLLTVMFSLGSVIYAQKEIVIDLIDEFVSTRVSRTLWRIHGFLAALVLAFIFWAMIRPTQEAYLYGDVSLELGFPSWTIWALALFGLSGGVLASFFVVFVGKPASEAGKVEEGL